jgi:putative membrane protein
MRWIFRILGVILFVVFFVFALKNQQEVTLSFFPGGNVEGPLVILLLAFFAAGSALGVLAMMPTMFRYRREVSRVKKLLTLLQKDNDDQVLARAQGPLPDGSGQ